MLEFCIREDLKMKRPRMMAVLDPVKVVIDNYPQGQTEERHASQSDWFISAAACRDIRSRRNIDFPETVKKFATMRYPQR